MVREGEEQSGEGKADGGSEAERVTGRKRRERNVEECFYVLLADSVGI